MKFAIGDKVVCKTSVMARGSYPVMQVVGYLEQGIILLTHWGDGFDGELNHYDFYDNDKPGSRNWRNGIGRYIEEELYTPDEALAEIRKLEEADSKLDAEFNQLKNKISSSLEQAAALVDKVATLTQEHKKTFEDLLQECKPLYQALKKGGWRHSTFVCKFG